MVLKEVPLLGSAVTGQTFTDVVVACCNRQQFQPVRHWLKLWFDVLKLFGQSGKVEKALKLGELTEFKFFFPLWRGCFGKTMVLGTPYVSSVPSGLLHLHPPSQNGKKNRRCSLWTFSPQLVECALWQLGELICNIAIGSWVTDGGDTSRNVASEASTKLPIIFRKFGLMITIKLRFVG